MLPVLHEHLHVSEEGSAYWSHKYIKTFSLRKSIGCRIGIGDVKAMKLDTLWIDTRIQQDCPTL